MAEPTVPENLVAPRKVVHVTPASLLQQHLQPPGSTGGRTHLSSHSSSHSSSLLALTYSGNTHKCDNLRCGRDPHSPASPPYPPQPSTMGGGCPGPRQPQMSQGTHYPSVPGVNNSNSSNTSSTKAPATLEAQVATTRAPQPPADMVLGEKCQFLDIARGSTGRGKKLVL